MTMKCCYVSKEKLTCKKSKGSNEVEYEDRYIR